MAATAAHLLDHVIPQVPVRQWVLSFPMPLRILFATHPQLLSPVLRVIHRVIANFLLTQAGLKHSQARTGALMRMSWARLLKRVFDIEHCPHCGGNLRIIAAIEDTCVIERILSHLGLPIRAPPRSPAHPFPLFQAS